MRASLLFGAVLVLAPAATAADPQAPAPAGHVCGAPPTVAETRAATPPPATSLLTGYGTGGFAVRTASPQAQAFFDNGMQLGHAFAHKPSIAAFEEAERLDPTCAMCAWGEAWARGPTINYTIDDKTQAELAVIADKAARLAQGGPPKEQRLAAALQLRYRHGGGAGAGDDAFAKAMDQLARDYPQDNEIAVVAADAWMIPASQRNSQKNLPRATALLVGALTRAPQDTGAIHFYIHVTEMAGVGGMAERYAETLQRLAPAASHLVHMPSHTYYLVGRYEDAVRSNIDATAIDRANAERMGLGGDAWKLFYHSHNVQFATGAALMSGDAAAALVQSRDALAYGASAKALTPWDHTVIGTAYFAQGRFAAPAQVLALPDPAAQGGYIRAMWRYARGEAYARLGDAAGVRREAALISLSPADLKVFGPMASGATAMADVARNVLDGRAAMLEDKPLVAAAAYRRAAEIQESRLGMMTDPPVWWFPVRRSYAAALLQAGKADEAATQARKVLAKWRQDPVTLAVLAQAERKLGDGKAADLHLAQSRAGWHGETRLAASGGLPAA